MCASPYNRRHDPFIEAFYFISVNTLQLRLIICFIRVISALSAANAARVLFALHRHIIGKVFYDRD